jgi:hypothetical protein
MYCNFFGYLCVHCHLSRANKRWVWELLCVDHMQ